MSKYSAHPALQIKKADEQSDVRKLQTKTPQGRGRAGGFGRSRVPHEPEST